ncbi:Hypothetical protein SCLAV_p0091 (plasmid) [Streptomyces clavuligerus]|uniref:Uncharacterized protein n=1 Tax=Streptomyces clavuligerus TaxID=1901 RepID=B5GW18_STRCL|nr:hypothetical protein SSCG_03661 [Streptomyces clavuligerus]EFG03582.1 Hypothetical protein SCLAV_p0091 [Streptomyces clavuligerus]
MSPISRHSTRHEEGRPDTGLTRGLGPGLCTVTTSRGHPGPPSLPSRTTDSRARCQ